MIDSNFNVIKKAFDLVDIPYTDSTVFDKKIITIRTPSNRDIIDLIFNSDGMFKILD